MKTLFILTLAFGIACNYAATRSATKAQAAPDSRLEQAAALYEKALKEQNDAAFAQARADWQNFLNQFPGSQHYDKAQYNLAFCQFHLGQIDETIQGLTTLIPEISDAALAVDSRLLLAEAKLKRGGASSEEALAVTYEILPDKAAEKTAGLKRDANAIGTAGNPLHLDAIQTIRLYLLRGEAFAALHKSHLSKEAFKQARSYLEKSKKSQLSQVDASKLIATLALHELKGLNLICKETIRPPEKLSEAEFLAYANRHYDCAAPARALICEVLTAKDAQASSPAINVYRTLVEAPLALKDRLPPPARHIRKKEQKTRYESELKALIEKTVKERSQEFRHLDSCNVPDVY